jgi:hypothetical protein
VYEKVTLTVFLRDCIIASNASTNLLFRVVFWGGFIHGGGEGCINILVGRPEGRRPLGRPRRRWEDNIKMDLREMARSCEHGNEPSIKCGKFLD